VEVEQILQEAIEQMRGTDKSTGPRADLSAHGLTLNRSDNRRSARFHKD
jgi:hypothetical protein